MGQPIPMHELREQMNAQRPQREQELLGKLELVAAELHRESLWSGPDIERALVLERARRDLDRITSGMERDLATLERTILPRARAGRGERQGFEKSTAPSEASRRPR